MSLSVKIRKGEGRVFGRAKAVAKWVLEFHVPVGGPTRALFRTLYRLHVAGRELGIWVLRFCWYEPLFRSQCESVGERFRMETLPYIVGRGRIVIGTNVRLSGKPSFTFGNRGHGGTPEVRIGDNTFIGHGCAFSVARSVRIGDHCYLAGHVQVQDFDGHPVDAARRRAGEPTPPEGMGPITIGDDVWIGAGSLLLKGVTIGNRVAIGARSVVTKDVPSDVVIAGNPARVVRHLAPADYVAATENA